MEGEDITLINSKSIQKLGRTIITFYTSLAVYVAQTWLGWALRWSVALMPIREKLDGR